MPLILGRQLGEEVVLHTSDGPIVIWVSQRTGRAGYRLSIDAPDCVDVYRREIDPHSPSPRKGGS